jgi:hypothetical protein
MPTTYAIPDGRVAMAATLYTGTLLSNPISNAVNGVSFQPDWVWVKSRSAATDNKLTDSVRGVTKGLVSNSTAAETTDTQGLTAFSSGGFTVGTNTDYNNLAATYVAWQWKAGGTAVSNTAGSITSSVSANTTAGFSVVTYTGTGANATVGHGLGVAPSMVITKSRNDATYGWATYHASVGAGACLFLNTTGASNSGANIWNNTAPTSSVFSIGTDAYANFSAKTYVAYCFAPVAGYSAFGSYTGNGSADGPFLYFGFRPRWIMYKRTDSTGQWNILDTSRSLINAANTLLRANLSGADETNTVYDQDFLSNGWKIRSTNVDINASSATYIYMAFAENPTKFSNAR